MVTALGLFHAISFLFLAILSLASVRDILSQSAFGMLLGITRSVEQAAPQSAVASVMAKFGFNDKSDFTRSFRKAYGVPPSDYRRNSIDMW